MIVHFDPSNVSCDHVRRFLYEYVERELDARLLMAMDNHVLACRECQTLVESYQQSVEAARDHIRKSEKIPSNLKDDLLRTLTDMQE